MENSQKLTKAQKKELRKLEWQEKAKVEQRNAKVKKYGIWAVAAIIIVGVIFVLIQIVNAPSTPAQQTTIAPISSKDIGEGNPNSKVKLIEYADFQCPACGAYHPIVNQILSDYKGKIFYVYRMFPLTNAHPNAFVAAQAAYAAFKQGSFFQMEDYLYNRQSEWADLQNPTTAFADYAKLLKLDVNKFKTDMNSDAAKNFVQNSENEALSAGINQTPTFFINGVEIQNPNSYSDFKKLIDNELTKK